MATGNPYHKKGGVPEGGQFTSAIDQRAINDALVDADRTPAELSVGQSILDRIKRVFKLGEDDRNIMDFYSSREENLGPAMSLLQAAGADGVASAIEEFAGKYRAATQVLRDGELIVYLKGGFTLQTGGALGVTIPAQKSQMSDGWLENRISLNEVGSLTSGGNQPTVLGFAIDRETTFRLFFGKDLGTLGEGLRMLQNKMATPVNTGVLDKLKSNDVVGATRTLFHNATLHELSHAMDASTNEAASDMLMKIAHQAAGSTGFGTKGPGKIKTWTAARVSQYAASSNSPRQFKAELFAETMTAHMVGGKVTPALKSFTTLTNREWVGPQAELFP